MTNNNLIVAALIKTVAAAPLAIAAGLAALLWGNKKQTEEID